MKPEAGRQKLVAPPQRLVVGIAAQRPGTEHFEQGQMRVVADLVQVGRSDASLRPDQTVTERMGIAFEISSQRMHAAGDQQHRVVGLGRDEGRALDAAMIAPDEELDERGVDFVGMHGGGLLGVW